MLFLRGMRYVEQDQRVALLWGQWHAATPGESGLKVLGGPFVAISPGGSGRGRQ